MATMKQNGPPIKFPSAARAVLLEPLSPRTILLVLALQLGGCATTPEPATPRQSGKAELVNYALSLRGAPYRYGMASPENGFDCSGFVWHVYRKHGFPLPRTTEQMAQALPPVAAKDRLPGDLLFFNTNGKPFSHVGIYVGNDAFVHAPSTNSGQVIVSSLNLPYWWQRFIGVRRPGLAGR